jgi:hypothetical protein
LERLARADVNALLKALQHIREQQTEHKPACLSLRPRQTG